MKINRLSFSVLILVSSFLNIGCTNNTLPTSDTTTVYTNKSIGAEEVLMLEPNADIFQFDEIIYKTNIEWVDNLTVTKNSQLGEIKMKNEKDANFENEFSNKLPIGIKIFSTKERTDVLVVEIDGKLKKYLAIVEG